MSTRKRPRIVVVGAHTAAYLMKCDRLPRPGEYLVANEYVQTMDGAKGSNQALAAARLGGDVSLITRLGNDEHGDFARDYLTSSGVNLDHSRTSETARTGFGIAFLGNDGTPMGATELGALKEFSYSDIDAAIPAFEGADTLLVQLELDVDVALYACEVGKHHGLTVIMNPSPADDLVTRLPLVHVDLLTPNEPEAKLLVGHPPDAPMPHDELGRMVSARTGVENVLITLGGAGATLVSNGDVVHFQCPAVDAVDTSGAGDCVNAALACELAASSLHDSVHFALAAASLAVSKPEVWPSYPTRDEVDVFRKTVHPRSP